MDSQIITERAVVAYRILRALQLRLERIELHLRVAPCRTYNGASLSFPVTPRIDSFILSQRYDYIGSVSFSSSTCSKAATISLATVACKLLMVPHSPQRGYVASLHVEHERLVT
jgi:hypothetical protein